MQRCDFAVLAKPRGLPEPELGAELGAGAPFESEPRVVPGAEVPLGGETRDLPDLGLEFAPGVRPAILPEQKPEVPSELGPRTEPGTDLATVVVMDC